MVQSEIPIKQWYRPEELAAIIEEPLRNVMYWIQHDKIRHTYFGRKIKIPKDEVERLIAEGVKQ